MTDQTSDNANKQYEIGGQTFTLEMLTQLDLSGVQSVEAGFIFFPPGVFEFEVGECKLEDLGGMPCFRNPMKCVNVVSLADASGTPERWINEVHDELQFLRGDTQEDIMKSLGMQKDLMEKTGLQVAGPVQQCLMSWTGTRFRAAITNTKAKTDPSKIYANLDRKNIVPLVMQQQVAGQAPGQAPGLVGGNNSGLNLGQVGTQQTVAQ